MNRNVILVVVGVLAVVIASSVIAHTNYLGYSNAPGSRGSCATSCHGTGGGTLQVTGFPSTYVPTQAYTITVSRGTGSSIKNFNASCRVAGGSTPAGTLAAGTGTATYNVTGETNGVHLTTADQDMATFSWTAPAVGTGDVTLYVAGHQGNVSGANTEIALTATEQVTGIADVRPGRGYALEQNYPNPFTDRTQIDLTVPHATPVLLEVYDAAGARILSRESFQEQGTSTLAWDGSVCPAGVYYYRVRAGAFEATRRMTLAK